MNTKTTIYQLQICEVAHWLDVGSGWIKPDRPKAMAESLAKHGLKVRVLERTQRVIFAINPDNLK